MLIRSKKDEPPFISLVTTMLLVINISVVIAKCPHPDGGTETQFTFHFFKWNTNKWIANNKKHYDVGDGVEYECYSDSTLIGNSRRKCVCKAKYSCLAGINSDYDWTDEEPKCITNECDRPSPNNTKISFEYNGQKLYRTSNRFPVGSTATYLNFDSFCADNKVKGNLTRPCESGGIWSGKEPSCDTKMIINSSTLDHSISTTPSLDNPTFMSSSTASPTEPDYFTDITSTTLPSKKISQVNLEEENNQTDTHHQLGLIIGPSLGIFILLTSLVVVFVWFKNKSSKNTIRLENTAVVDDTYDVIDDNQTNRNVIRGEGELTYENIIPIIFNSETIYTDVHFVDDTQSNQTDLAGAVQFSHLKKAAEDQDEVFYSQIQDQKNTNL